MLKRISLLIVIALMSILISATGANAWQVEPANKSVKNVKVSYIEPFMNGKGKPRLFVEWNDGAAHTLKPCKYEDSPNCYWDAGTFGNKRGHSFIDARNRLWYVKM